MNTNKNLWKKGVVLVAAATMIAGAVPTVNAFAYGAYDVSKSTFKDDTAFFVVALAVGISGNQTTVCE